MRARLHLARVASSPSGVPGLSSAVAKAKARLERPDPGGPVISHECVIDRADSDGPSREPPAAAALKTAMASSCPVRSSHTAMPSRLAFTDAGTRVSR